MDRCRGEAKYHLADLGIRNIDRRGDSGLSYALEFSYTQGPVKMKSLIMCTYLLAISFGNQLTAAVNFVIQNPDGSVKLQGASYFMFFVYVMLGTAVVFVIVTPFYKGRTYLQDQTAVIGDAEPAIGFAVQPEA